MPTRRLASGAAPGAPAAPVGPLAQGERLQDLTADAAQALADAGARRRWRRGQVVLHQGQAVGQVVVALEGRLAVRLQSPGGRETLLRALAPGELVALAAVLAGTPFPVTLVAQGPAATLHIERAAFIGVLRRHPEAAIGIATLLSHRLNELFHYLEHATGGSTLPERVQHALQRMRSSHGEPLPDGRLRLRTTQAEVAEAAGGSRQRVHAELQRLQAEGRLQIGYRSLILPP